MKILIIDDDPMALKILSYQLESLGVTDLTSASSGHEALSLAQAAALAEKFDLIFCDLQMPEMDGVEFIRHLLGMNYRGDLILVSGEDERVLQTVEKLAKAHNLHVLGALRKPVNLSDLQQTVNRAVSRHEETPAKPRKIYSIGEIKNALTQGQLVNYYQPKVALATGAITGMETLVRWNHPEDGLVFPDQFVGVVEEYDLIDDMTRSILTSAVQHARSWHDAGFPLHVAVNVSMRNLGTLAFPEFVAQVARQAGIDLHFIVLEVTESMLMRDPRAALDVLSRLRLRKVGLSIDDFGTGHSSLAQLRDIPFNELKIDRGFVHGACHNSSLAAILNSSLALARQLGMKTVAEGIEDRDDWDHLLACGCDLGQGYFIARPMPANLVISWIREWESRPEKRLACAS